MKMTGKSGLASHFSGAALGIALALGAVGASMAVPAMAKDAKPAPLKLSPNFQKLAGPFIQTLNSVKTRADVVAAKGNPAALGTALTKEKADLDAIFAAIASPDDRMMAGQLALNMGGVAEDQAMQRRGIVAMLESGKTNPADTPKLQFYAGQLAYVARDFPAARTALQAAVSAGYHDNDADVLLAEAYMSDNQIPQGLTMLKQAIDLRNATPTKAPANWYRRGLGAAYKAQQLDKAADFALGLVTYHPTADNWAGAITVVREIGHYPAQETLDLMRLMDRTKSWSEERDYIEYIQAADARRLPGEVLKIIEAGVASGKLKAGDQFVTEARGIASARVAADRASLPGLERDARAPSATGATVAGAADAFLSYADAAKAESLYSIAVGKPGVDVARVNTRLGIAQLDQGNVAGAQASFAKVTDGPRKYIAQLWGIFASQKLAK